MTVTEDAEFCARDLIGSAGIGGNGEKLVNTLQDYYPPELQVAQLKRVNPELSAELDDGDVLAQVARIAGVERIAHAVVAGGIDPGDEAVVRYAVINADGTVSKGFFPYTDLESGSSDRHVSQRASLAQGVVASEVRQSREYAGVAPGETVAAAPEQPLADPYEALEGLSAADTVKLMEANPERAEAIKAFEEASRGDRARKSVLEWEPPEGDSDSGD